MANRFNQGQLSHININQCTHMKLIKYGCMNALHAGTNEVIVYIVNICIFSGCDNLR